MGLRVAQQHRSALLATIVGAGVVAAGSMVAILVKSWFKRPRVPITILSGFLGAGKTTLLSRLLRNANGLRIAVLVNDLAEVNVDARLLLAAGAGTNLAAFHHLENGCLCCSTEADVVGAVVKLLETGGEFDHLVIECSGMAQVRLLELWVRHRASHAKDREVNDMVEIATSITNMIKPSSLIELFTKAEMEGHVYKNVAVLNQMVTLVDGRTLLRWLEVANGSAHVNISDEAGSLAELLVEQIECADLVVLSKVDCLQQTQIRKCLAAIRALNANAAVECAAFGEVPPTVIFGTRKEHLSSHRKENAHSHHDHQGHEHGHPPHARSFVYKSRAPFQPQRLVITLRRLRTQIEASSSGESKCVGRGVLRAKGLVWLATDMKRAREWAQVGETLHLHYGEFWKEEWTAAENGRAQVGYHPGSYGDRQQEIVFIGTGEMQETDIRNALDNCLLTSEEMELGPGGWLEFPDPIAVTPMGPRHKKPTTHGVGCACCDPELKLIDQAVARQLG